MSLPWVSMPAPLLSNSPNWSQSRTCALDTGQQLSELLDAQIPLGVTPSAEEPPTRLARPARSITGLRLALARCRIKGIVAGWVYKLFCFLPTTQELLERACLAPRLLALSLLVLIGAPVSAQGEDVTPVLVTGSNAPAFTLTVGCSRSAKTPVSAHLHAWQSSDSEDTCCQLPCASCVSGQLLPQCGFVLMLPAYKTPVPVFFSETSLSGGSNGTRAQGSDGRWQARRTG